MKRSLDSLSSLERYTVVCERAAGQIIGAYSTSFGTSTQLLGRRHRRHVRNIYALVRVADELVDGATGEAGIPPEQQHRALDWLEEETNRAMATGYSSNPIVHAFAHTARESGIGTDLTAPFFASMRTDLPAPERAINTSAAPGTFDDAAHAEYVYGSAQVVGLMCLRVFVREETFSPGQHAALERGAQSLGSAFQNVNFLRDLADDTSRLGRSYLSDRGTLTPDQHQRWVAVIREQLDDAAATLPLLPSDARVAVGSALRLFARLTDKIAATPTSELYERRIRVAGIEKTWIVAQAARAARKGRD